MNLLYSYRRCPYAIRARMSLRCAGITFEVREISLRDKPADMLSVSPKGTVPVLVCDDGTVIDESLNIMHWALAQHDPLGWLAGASNPKHQEWISRNDKTFKYWLDRYKYAERYPEFDAPYYRKQALECLLDDLESQLTRHAFLGGESAVLSDVAIFPFIRQFAAVDPAWFASSQYVATRRWLQYWIESDLFKQIMEKRQINVP